MKYGLIALTVALLFACQAHARMYQWHNPTTGSVQLSGSAPAWYRSGAPGPRIFVFENGRLVDDTGVALSQPQREQLRAAAFVGEEAPVEHAADRQVTVLKQALEEAAEGGIDVSAITEEFTNEKEAAEAAAKEASEPDGVAETVAELKALLDAWDQTRLAEAQSLLERAVQKNETADGSAP